MALAITRKRINTQSSWDLPTLSLHLATFSIILGQLGHLKSAVGLAEEVVEIHRKLTVSYPGAFHAELAFALINLCALLSRSNRGVEALKLAREAVAIVAVVDAGLPRSHLTLRRTVYCNLGILLLELGKPERRSAYETFEKAVACAEAFRGSVEAVEDRQRLSGEGFGAYAGLVEAGVALWEEQGDAGALEAALAASEGVRGRSLLDRLGQVGAEPTGEAAQQRWRELRVRLDAAEAAYRHSLKRRQSPPPPDGTKGQSKSASFGSAEEPEPEPEAPPVAALRRVLAERQALIAELRREPANRDFDPDRPVPVADVAGFRLWLAAQRTDAVVEYFVGERMACAFVVTPAGPLKVVRLPGLNRPRVAELGRQWRAGYDPRDEAEAQAWREDRDRHTAALRQWGGGLPAKLRELAELAVWPVLRALGLSPSRAQPGRLLVIPHWELGFFPLHACPLGQADPRLVAEVWEVAYAPVFSLLPMIGRRDAVGPAPSGLVANPTNDLAYTTLLGLEIEQQRQGIRTLWGSEADEAALLGLAADSRDLFLCGHMQAGHGDSEPALVLALKQRLTVTDLYVKLRLPLGRMVVLNGCESGLLMPKAGGGTEYEGLPLAFLFRGASVVVSTLWTVFDISSALLLRRFLFELPRQQGLPGPALREATRWLREDIRDADELEREVEELLAELERAFKPDRHPLTSFAQIAKDARDQVDHYRRESPNAPPFASPLHWAAHTVSGLAHAPVLG
jgi:hypothetical protein